VRLYLDSSAVVKLVQREAESTALRRYLRRHRGDDRVTSTLARTEVVRAVLPGGGAAVGMARRQLGLLFQIPLDVDVLDQAATIAPEAGLRTLDAIHLVSARRLGAELRAVVTYDQRMADAAVTIGLPVEGPA
jgi:predicted nucleic acid-binding protein